MQCRLRFDIDWPSLFRALLGLPASKKTVERSAAQLRQFHPGKTSIASLSVRTLFDAVLSERAGKAGDTILMSAVNIRGMFDIASAHGYAIQCVDIDPQTLAPPPGALLRAQRQSGAGVCVISQLFGSANRLDEAAELRARGVFVMEDAAQSFGKDHHHGDRDADCSLFSFGPIKRYTALGGGIGVFADRELAERVEDRLRSYPKKTDGWFRRRAMKYIALKLLSSPVPYGLLIRAIERAGRDPDTTIGKLARGFGGQTLISAIRFQPPERMLVLMAQRLFSAGGESERQTRSRALLETLDPDMRHIGRRSDKHAHWLCPVYVAEPRAAVRTLRALGFDATRGATSLCVLDEKATPNAAHLLDHIVYLPSPADMNEPSRQRLATALQNLDKH